MLDKGHEQYTSQVPNNHNSYVLGRIYGHNMVIAYLSAGVHGTVSAATVANNVLRTFSGIRFSLIVGIRGGILNINKGVDIRLGDMVVSQPSSTHDGVVQYDFRKNLGDGVFERKGFLRPPLTVLLTALSNLQSPHRMYGNQISETFSVMIERLPRLPKVGYEGNSSIARVFPQRRIFPPEGLPSYIEEFIKVQNCRAARHYHPRYYHSYLEGLADIGGVGERCKSHESRLLASVLF